MSALTATVVILGLVGVLGALLLYIVARRFRVDEDPRIARITALLPGANCGGCGQKGCRDFACRCVSTGRLDGLYCPVGGDIVMAKIAEIIGVDASVTTPMIAVLRCNGACDARPGHHVYDGAGSCAVIAAAEAGPRGCRFGCLGCGDCTSVCHFDAIHLDSATRLPVIDPDHCTACGKCAGACPRNLIQLRPRGRRERRVWVACLSHDRGAAARKACANACIGCGKCVRTCPFSAIDIIDNVAVIDPDRCRACGKCLSACPTGAIHATFTPPTPQSQTTIKVNEACNV